MIFVPCYESTLREYCKKDKIEIRLYIGGIPNFGVQVNFDFVIYSAIKTKNCTLMQYRFVVIVLSLVSNYTYKFKGYRLWSESKYV